MKCDAMQQTLRKFHEYLLANQQIIPLSRTTQYFFHPKKRDFFNRYPSNLAATFCQAFENKNTN